MTKYISKTKIKQNKQCKKALYLEQNHPELKVISEEAKASFTRGKDVEKIAKSEFKGKTVNGFRHEEKLAQTNVFIKMGVPAIYEASFLGDQVFIQVDILEKNSDGSYNAIEVKSGTKVNDEYFEDVLIQYFTILKSKSITLDKYYIWYINKKATGVKDLFIKEDITDQLKVLEDRYNELVKSAKDTLALTKVPDVKIGPHCTKPYDCPFMNHCWGKHLGNKDSVLNLPKIKGKWKLFDSGIEFITDEKFPLEDYKKSNPHIAKSILGNALEIDRESLVKSLKEYTSPLYFFDVETLMIAVPVLKNQNPYQQVVVQYSVHKLDELSNISRTDFLHDSKESPEAGFLDQLISDLGDHGDIVVYNKAFEESRLKELAEKPEHAHRKDQIYKLIARLKDLLDVVEKNVYHPDFKGSFSLKAITTVLLKGYEGYVNSKIKKGTEVSEVYIAYLNETNPQKKQELKNQLLEYNRLDTINVLLIYIYFMDESFDLSKYLTKLAKL